MARRAKRPTNWFGATWDNTSLGGDNTVGHQTLVSLSDVSGWSEPTVVRIRGVIFLTHARVNLEATQGFVWWLGIHCADPDLPSLSPKDDVDSDHWLWLGMARSVSYTVQVPLWNGSSVITTARSNHDQLQLPTVVDSRAMRKLPDPCEIRLAYEIQLIGTEPTSSHLTGFVRCLLKE